jgi:predicted ATPase
VCTKCNEEKELALMTKKESICKNCDCIRSKKYREANREKVAQKKKGYYEKHKEEINQKCREYYEENKEELRQKGKEYRENNLEKIKEYQTEYREENKEEINKKKMDYKRKRLAEDPLFKLIDGLRSRILLAIKSQAGEKAAKSMELLGCSVQHVRDHLESQFTEGMTWENRGEWHIDHIRPCASFDLTDPEEQKKCFHWTNLQPLWAKDNIIKSDRLDWVKAQN